MLADKDRIFTNVYGYQPWSLKAAQARGDWDNTKAILAKGRDAIIEEMKGIRFATTNREAAKIVEWWGWDSDQALISWVSRARKLLNR